MTDRGPWRAGTRAGRPRAIPLDEIEFPDYYEFKADIPGQSKDKIQVTIDGHRLHITVDRTEEEEQKPEANYLIAERPTGWHSRNPMLPPGADPNGVQATYENGGHKASTIVGAVAVLVVKIPKTEEYKALQPKKVEIT